MNVKVRFTIAAIVHLGSLALIALLLGSCSPLSTPNTLEASYAPSIVPNSTAVASTAPTVKSTATTVTLSSTPDFTATPDPTNRPALSTLFEFVCSHNACVYESWQEASDGSYVLHAALDESETASEFSLARALDLSFANFDNQIAYWIGGEKGQLWLSTLSNHDALLIFTDTDDKYPIDRLASSESRVRTYWTPDDQHLIIDAPPISAPDLIFHTSTQVLEEWPWVCDRIALSPRSGQLAIWCVSAVGDIGFEVVEWKGEIWHSDLEPDQIVVHGISLTPPVASNYLVRPWAWSATGEQFAYYDPNGELHVTNGAGEEKTTLAGHLIDPSAGGWFSGEELKWSQDGTRLLLYAFGTQDHPCPQFRSLTGEAPEYRERQCWQVFDTATDSVIWTVSDVAAELMALVPVAVSDIREWFINDGVLSHDGSRIALSLTNGSFNYGYVVNIDNNYVVPIDAPIIAMRWESTP